MGMKFQWSLGQLPLQHSLSNIAEAKFRGEVFDLWRWESFSECVDDCVSDGAVNKLYLLLLYNPMDEMEVYIKCFIYT